MTVQPSTAELIDRWPSRAALANDIGDKNAERINKWAQSGNIPSWELEAVLKSARLRGVPLTPDELIRAQRKRDDAKPSLQKTKVKSS